MIYKLLINLPRLLTLSILLSFPGLVHAQHPPVFEGMKMDTLFVDMYSLPLKVVKYSYGKPNVNFLVIHDNEDTGVKAAFEYIRFSGGSVFDSQYGDLRNYNINYQGLQYQIDPNKIYSSYGVMEGLEFYGAVNDEVSASLNTAAEMILNFYNPGKPDYIFTLHNNTDGAFGINSYLKGHELELVADSLHINFNMDPDDLILVTDLKLFNALKKEDVNVVLQSRDAADDGSLSLYAMQNKIPYINVEVQHGHQLQNLQLIEIAVKALKTTYPELF
ncbi:hypothetical protein ACTHQF_09845 [Pedobacter sp. SAFR-022]|uniref:hypothetical protein n=1 Tax=Pedobacter sp. SAFR-022 TaxID=3436861 RepID=UPI003F806A0B